MSRIPNIGCNNYNALLCVSSSYIKAFNVLIGDLYDMPDICSSGSKISYEGVQHNGIMNAQISTGDT